MHIKLNNKVYKILTKICDCGNTYHIREDLAEGKCSKCTEKESIKKSKRKPKKKTELKLEEESTSEVIENEDKSGEEE